MGGAQSAQREDKKDPTAEAEAEESGKVDDAQTEQHVEDKPLKNNGQISEISGKADDTVAEVNSHCEDEIAAEAIVSPDANVSEAEKPLKEETSLQNVEINEKESPNDVDANEDEEVPLETIEMDAKNNDINESFRRFFSNINVKVTVKRGSAEKDDVAADMPDDTAKEEPNQTAGTDDIAKEELNRTAWADDTAKEDKSENAENNMALNAAQETYDHDSSCPPSTDIISDDVLEKTEEKNTETKENVYSENAAATTTEPVGDDENIPQNATSEEEVIVSPVKRFFTSGIFSGLRKKKKSTEDETTEKELVSMLKVEAAETTEQLVEAEQERDKGSSLGAEAVTIQAQHKANGLKEEIPSAASALITDEGKSASTDPSTIVVNEPEILTSQEKDKVAASPLKRLLSGSSFKKTPKKQRERKSSEARLSDSGEHFSNQLQSPPDASDNQREDSPPGEEDGAWASFKKLMTPKKRMKRSSLTNEETPTPGLVQETKSSEGEQMSDNSTEESKKRKDSSISWEAVLCGSGRRRSRSRKTSDSEDEKPQDESDNRKQESPLESSNEVDKSQASYPKQEGSPSEGDSGSTWKSFKKLVTPKRKAKDDDIQSDGEATQDDSTFSIKKLLPGQKKRKPAEKQDYVSSDEADKEVASGDEDSETPAIVPLTEFDTVDTDVHLHTHAEVESNVPKEEIDYELKQDLERMTELVLICDGLQNEAKNDQNNEDALENIKQTSTTPNEEPDEISELLSKHQQLSDIPEEGIITETMVTPSSVNEQPARDDTIAEDLIEITSEAITAPEPVDITLADETEMISAVSQLSDSSKTSGNTTPVPAEYDVKDAEVLLQQVAEIISMSPKADPLYSDEISSERLAASVSCQILETFVKQQPTILEIHRRSDATAIMTGLNVKEFKAVNQLAATTQTESISEVNEAVSTEMVSEVPTEVGAAEHTVDEIHEVSVTHTEESIRELQSTKSHNQSEHGASTEILSESEETVECSLAETCPTEAESSQSDIQEEETKDGDVEQEVQPVIKTRGEILHNNTDQVQAEKLYQPCLREQELQALAVVKPDTFNSEKDIVQSTENKVVEAIPAVEIVTGEPKDELQVDEVPKVLAVQAAVLDSQISSIQIPEKEGLFPEDIPLPETVIDKPKAQPEPLSEVHFKPEREDELQADAAKTELGQEPEDLALQEAALDSETANIQTLGSKLQLTESISTEEAVTDQCQEEAEHLNETDVEAEIKELHEVVAKTEQGQVPEVLAVQAAAMDSQIGSIQKPGWKADAAKTEQTSKTLEEQTFFRSSHIGSIQMPEKELLLSKDSRLKIVTDEHKDQAEPLTEFNVELEKEDELQSDSAKTEHEEDPEVLAVQEAALDSLIVNIQTPERNVLLSKTTTDEPKDQDKPLTQEHFKPEDKYEPKKDADTEVSEILEEQATVPVSVICSIQMPEKELTLSEDSRQEEVETDKAKDETESELHADTAKIEHKQDPEVLEVTTFDIPPLEEVTDEAKQGTEPHAEVYMEPEKKNEQQAEDNKSEKAVTDEPKQGTESVTEVYVEPEKVDEQQAEDNKSQKAVTDEPIEELTSVTKVNAEVKNKDLKEVEVSEMFKCEQETAKTGHGQVPEVLPALDVQISSVQISIQEVSLSEDNKPEIPADWEAEPRPLTEVHVKPQQEDEQADATKTEEVQEKKDEQQVEDNKSEKAVTDEPKQGTESVTEVYVEPEKVDEQQAEDNKSQKAVTDEPIEELNSVTKVNAEVKNKDLKEVEVSEMFKCEQETVKTGLGQVPIVLPALDVQISSVQISIQEVSLSEDNKPEIPTDWEAEPRPLTEVHVKPQQEDEQADATKTEEVQETKDEQQVEDNKSEKAVTDEPKQGTESVTEVYVEPEKVDEQQAEDNKSQKAVTDEPIEELNSVTKVNAEVKNKDLKEVEVSEMFKCEQETVKTGLGQVPIVLPALDVQISSVQISIQEVSLSEDNKPEIPADWEAEPRPLTEVHVKPQQEDEQADATKTEEVQEKKDEQQVEDNKLQKAITDEPKQGTESVTEVYVEPEKVDEQQAEDNKSQKAVTDEPKQGTESITEVTVELKNKGLQADAVQTEQIEISEMFRSEQKMAKTGLGQVPIVLPALDVQISSVQISIQEVSLSEDNKPEIPADCEAEPRPLTEVHVKPQQEDEQADATKTEEVQEKKDEQQVEDNKLQKAITDEPKQGTESVTEVYVEPEKVDEQQAEDNKSQKAVTDEPIEELNSVTKVNAEVKNKDLKEVEVSEMFKCEQETLKTGLGQVPIVLPALDVQISSVQISIQEVSLSEDNKPEIPADCEAEPRSLTEVHVKPQQEDEQADATKTEEVQGSELLEGVQAFELDSQMGSIPEKEVPLSLEIKPENAVTDESGEERESVNEVHVEPEKEDELHEDVAKTEVQDSEILEVQSTALVSEIRSIHLPQKEETLSKDNKPQKAVVDELEEETEPVTKVQVEPEKKDALHEDATKTECEQDSKVLDVREAALDLKIVNYQTSGTKMQILEDIQPTETVTKETTQCLTVSTVATESEIKEPLRRDTPIMDNHQGTLALETAQVPTLDLQEAGAVEKDIISGATPQAEAVTDEPKEEKEPLTDVSVEPMDSSKTEPEVLEAAQVAKIVLEEGHIVSLIKEVISEDIPPTEVVTDEPTKATEGNAEPEEELPGRHPKREHVQASEALLCDVKNTVTETKPEKEISVAECVTESMEGVNAQETKTLILQEDIHSPDANVVIASPIDETESEVEAEANQDLEMNKNQNIEIIQQDVQVGQDDGIPEVVDKLETLSAVHLSSVTEEKKRACALEKKAISEKATAPCSNNATARYEPKHELHLSDVQGHNEREKESDLPGPEIKTSTAEHAVVTQMITCHLKEITAAIPDIVTEKPSNIHEPFKDAVVSELEFKEEALSTKVKNDVTETATESSVVVTKHVPSVEFEDIHTIQVQIVDDDIKSAEMNVDSVLGVGTEEAKEVIDVCHETIKAVDKLSATQETEEELISEENKATDHNVFQHVKENLAEREAIQTSTRDEAVNLEREYKKQPDVSVSEMAESTSGEVDDRKEDVFSQRQNEAPVVSDEAAAEQPVSEDVMQTPNTPGSLDISIQDHKEDVEENKGGPKTPDSGITAEDLKSSSEGLEVKKIDEEAQTTQSFLSQTVTVSNTGLEGPQKTGIISSIGHLESPSSLSLEFKLNIQFGQAKAPDSTSLATEKTEARPPPATEGTAQVKQNVVSEVGVQAVVPPKPINATLETQKESVLTEVTVQATEITEPELAHLDTTDRAVIMKQPVLLDIGIQSMEAAQPVEQVKSTERLTPSVPEAEKIKAVMQAETFLSQPVLYEACYEEIKVEEPVKQLEDENDQDLWVDAEEDIQTQEELDASLFKIKEPVATQRERDEEEKVEPDYEFEMAPEMAPKLKTKEEESTHEMHKVGEICELENEVEEFAVALEHPEITTTFMME